MVWDFYEVVPLNLKTNQFSHGQAMFDKGFDNRQLESVKVKYEELTILRQESPLSVAFFCTFLCLMLVLMSAALCN